jgi:DUF2933 family protein
MNVALRRLRACLDPRVLGLLAAAGVALWIVAPGLVPAAIPLLVVAACPLSMVVMMRSIGSATPERTAPAATESVADLRRQLEALAERQRRVESELAGAVERHHP